MEIIFELLLEVVGLVLRVIGELVLQLIFEALFDSAIHGAKYAYERREPLHPLLAAIGYLLLGAMAGWFSLWAFPSLILGTEGLRVLNLVITPLAAGATMAAIGAWRRRREREVVRLESFAYGYCFALAMAAIRFIWAG